MVIVVSVGLFKKEHIVPQPKQHQKKQPGIESKMKPRPRAEDPHYKGSFKLKGRVALITGGDSGIGRAVAISYAKEGADVAIVYLNEDGDARETQGLVEKEGHRCLLFRGDAGDEKFCKKTVRQIVEKLGRLDIVVNNAAEQHEEETLASVSSTQLEKTFRTNIYSYFFMSKAAFPYLKRGSAIINTTSVTAYRGSPTLLSYSATKGAIVTFTRSLSKALVEKGIRVNGVAPGPVWTPLIPASFDEDRVAEFGNQVPMKRAGQPEEIAPSYVFLASDDSSYMSGQVLHPNGGEVVNA
jgi:NAD(P)-dependent dehydrogenase (short-subunit alcohol dehydrogenase family)